MTGPEKQIPTDSGLTRVPRLASHLLRPISGLSLEFLSRIHYNSYKFNGLVFFFKFTEMVQFTYLFS